ncbi:hypothetical protein [Pseudoduganella albidiflava]|uniref:Uncharacterized protein n=1 Tax=Pseudoduganella albidiflava TaxID=321983 RepID=A0A411X2T8_9BURK|nr:hypothetical protein [Pseudoduganella albidiflava]QBI03297.1 hypothetical protein EYF70_22560 [Pseudoduganella albidiflava]GGY67968.1 hypothetical protein GCM10007387_57690 [Pseudoduganella albidiflava]
MRKYHQFVTTVDDVVQNAIRFNKDIEDKELAYGLQRIVPLVHHWYAYVDETGWFHFVPSKFAGYKNMTGKLYLASYNLPKAEGGLHGKETELALRPLSTRLQGEEWESVYSRELSAWLSGSWGFRRRAGATVSVLKGYPLDPEPYHTT